MGLYRDRHYVGVMEKRIEATIWGLGFRDIESPTMENQMEETMDIEMEIGRIQGFICISLAEIRGTICSILMGGLQVRMRSLKSTNIPSQSL